MRFSSALVSAAAVAPLVAAHGDAPMPQIVGLNMRDLKTRDMLSNLRARAAEVASQGIQEAQAAAVKRNENIKRQGNTDGQCGGSFGKCAEGYCCSASGWCGNTGDYCYAPGCQYQFGPGCPDNVTPAGADTSSIPRTKVGSVPYGGDGIYQCTTPGTVALTFDDGPQKDYTNHILDIFKSYNAKATFFITGNNINKGQIDTTPEFQTVIKRAYSEGHQLASHTWTHQDLSAISETDRKAQMIKLEMALRNLVGFIPTYMRPPYSSCTAQSGCEKTMADLGYHVTYFNVDTDDYNQDAANEIQNAKNNFRGNITAGGATPANSQWLSIAHDIHYQTAYNLTEYMLSTLTNLGYKAVTVGECLGDPVENWYRNGDGSSPNPPSNGGKPTTPDATCGGANGYTCQGSTFGNCCSAAGWCGKTDAYCGNGCQSAFGTCSSSSTPPGQPPVSNDGSCGGSKGQTCKGSSFGNCCSQYGWCGSTADHCKTGCNPAFGTCQ